MTVQGNQPSNATAAAEAAEWLLALQEPSRERRESFADWLRRSPVHVEEFLQLTALHGDLRRLLEGGNFDVTQLIADLKISDDNLIRISGHRAPVDDDPAILALTQAQDRRRRSVRLTFGLAFIAAVALISAAVWFPSATSRLGKHRFRTGIGEQLTVALTDGSHVNLNAASNLAVTVNGAMRELQLGDGEALFQVAKDAARPFRVHTRDAVIEAKGTQFDVNVTDDSTVVSLIEGHVLITTPRSTISLNPGEQVSIPLDASVLLAPHSADIKTVIAWTQHRLVFDDAPLSVVVAAFNRYSRQPFAIEDPSLRDVRITGSFDIGSSESFAASLSAAGAFRVTLDRGSYSIGR
jgi:transmembrane sensor